MSLARFRSKEQKKKFKKNNNEKIERGATF